MAHVTIERIAAVQAHIVETVTRTTDNSTLTEAEQDQLLAQSCAEACDLLRDWVNASWWDRDPSSGDKTIKELLPTQKEFAEFLGPSLKDILTRARRDGIDVADSTVDDAYKMVAATARRFPRMKRESLFVEAKNRVTTLQRDICTLAAAVREGKKPDPVWRRTVRRVLKALPGALLSAAFAMLAASPAVMAHNAAAWGEPAVHAAEVIAVHYVAAQAQPNLVVAPPSAGPRIR